MRVPINRTTAFDPDGSVGFFVEGEWNVRTIISIFFVVRGNGLHKDN